MSPPADGGRTRGGPVRLLKLALPALLVAAAASMALPPRWLGLGSMTADALEARLARGDADLAVVDVRTGFEFRGGHIPGAVPVPLHRLPFRVGTLALYRDREVVLICLTGHRSRLAGLMLRLAGFARLTNLEGGMAAWRARGYREEGGAGS